MSTNRAFLAIDLGAESGRAILGTFDGDMLGTEEIHRFPNQPVRVCGRLYWDVLRLFGEIEHALGICAARDDIALESVGVDTWGVDFALLGPTGHLLENPVHYRDPRTDGMMDDVFTRVPREDVFETTGIQFMQINTLYQLRAMAKAKSPVLDVADRLLMMPDLFNYFLCGEKVSEFTIATTTQAYDPRAADWAHALLDALDIPTRIMPEIVQPGTVLGPVTRAVADEVGCTTGVRVVAPATHDTGSAVAGIPVESAGTWAYLSSGTWSLLGAEVPEPVISPDALAYNFTNEGGVTGTFRLLKNITGLWLLQECRRAWAAAGDLYDYTALTDMAEEGAAFAALVDSDDPGFLRPASMPAAIVAYLERTGQDAPTDRAAMVRCIFESLAMKYRFVLDNLNRLRGCPADVLHIVGGGSQNELLCQWAADATGIPVVAGPSEATAYGNLIVQAIAAGVVGSLGEARSCIRRSVRITTYEPRNTDRWNTAYERFLELGPR